jgi:hypothetical protein
MSMPKEPLYVSFPFGAGLAYAPHAGNTITPAPRAYRDPAHAQLANPAGRLYVVEIEGETMTVVARYDGYPLTLQAVREPGFGAGAEGSVVLRDLGPAHRDGHRYVTHWRNDQVGGHGGGNYHATLASAVEDFTDRIKAPLSRCADMEAIRAERPAA